MNNNSTVATYTNAYGSSNLITVIPEQIKQFLEDIAEQRREDFNTLVLNDTHSLNVGYDSVCAKGERFIELVEEDMVEDSEYVYFKDLEESIQSYIQRIVEKVGKDSLSTCEIENKGELIMKKNNCEHLGKGNLGVCYNENSEHYERDCINYEESKKMFKIPVAWEMYGFTYIEAETLEEALQIAERDLDDIPLPTDGNYVTASFAIDYDSVEDHNAEE